MNKSCLIIIDMQNGVFKQKNEVFNSAIIIKNAENCIRNALSNNIEIVITQHENKSSLIKHSEAWDLFDSLKNYSNKTYILEKKHPSIYKNTELQIFLQQNEISTIYIGGLVSNGCVKAACLESNKNGYNVFLISDCHSTVYKNAGKIITEVNNEMEEAGIDLITTQSFVENCA
jgi:nicotinamidase-related amidase